MTRHFLREDDLSPTEQAEVPALAGRLKAAPYSQRPVEGRQAVGIIFDKPTLRTRASVADVARVLGRMVSVVFWRTFGQDRLAEMAAHAGVPVVNGLTDELHPRQLLADPQTIAGDKGALAGLRVTFLRDAPSSMSHSFLPAGSTAGMHVTVGGPAGFQPDPAVLARGREIAGTTGGSVCHVQDPIAAVQGSDVVVTDTWVSMGGYRGREIAAEVIDGHRSVGWDEAENRLHAQKALPAWLLTHQDPSTLDRGDP